jgi:hypothetical protein
MARKKKDLFRNVVDEYIVTKIQQLGVSRPGLKEEYLTCCVSNFMREGMGKAEAVKTLAHRMRCSERAVCVR